MSKKIKTLITLIIIFTLMGIIFFLSTDQKNSKTGLSNEIIPQFTNNEEVNKIIFDNTEDLKQAFGISVLNDNSLVNLVHVVKEKDSSYKIFCEFGPAYKSANLNKFYSKEIVSMGQIKDCNIETAKAIDMAINSPEKDCRVPMDTTNIFSSLTDYYLVTLGMKEHEITQEWVDRTEGKQCFEPLKNLLGESIAVEFITVIIELESNRLFY